MQLCRYICSPAGTDAPPCIRERLQQGGAVVFFAEGTRGTKDGHLAEFKLGAFRLACSEGVCIVPVTIIGTGSMNPKGDELRLKDGEPPRVVIHPPIEPGEMKEEELCRVTRSVVASRLPSPKDSSGQEEVPVGPAEESTRGLALIGANSSSDERRT